VGRDEPFQGEIRLDVAIVYQYPVIFNQEVFDIFSARRRYRGGSVHSGK
jgi:hypothetical protein